MLLSTAFAAPPDLPLSPCVDDEGLRTGACPKESPDVAGTAVGRLSFNSSTGAYVEPQIPACNTSDAHGTGNEPATAPWQVWADGPLETDS